MSKNEPSYVKLKRKSRAEMVKELAGAKGVIAHLMAQNEYASKGCVVISLDQELAMAERYVQSGALKKIFLNAGFTESQISLTEVIKNADGEFQVIASSEQLRLNLLAKDHLLPHSVKILTAPPLWKSVPPSKSDPIILTLLSVDPVVSSQDINVALNAWGCELINYEKVLDEHGMNMCDRKVTCYAKKKKIHIKPTIVLAGRVVAVRNANQCDICFQVGHLKTTCVDTLTKVLEERQSLGAKKKLRKDTKKAAKMAAKVGVDAANESLAHITEPCALRRPTSPEYKIFEVEQDGASVVSVDPIDPTAKMEYSEEDISISDEASLSIIKREHENDPEEPLLKKERLEGVKRDFKNDSEEPLIQQERLKGVKREREIDSEEQFIKKERLEGEREGELDLEEPLVKKEKLEDDGHSIDHNLPEPSVKMESEDGCSFKDYLEQFLEQENQ